MDDGYTSISLRDAQRILPIVIDAVPAKRAEGSENGGEGFALLFAFTVLDGGGAAEAAGAFDADDGAAAVEMDPVRPDLAFMAGFEMSLAQGRKKFGDGARFLRAGDDKLGFHGGVRESRRAAWLAQGHLSRIKPGMSRRDCEKSAARTPPKPLPSGDVKAGRIPGAKGEEKVRICRQTGTPGALFTVSQDNRRSD